MEPKYTKMIQNYLDTKKEYSDCILFYRLGDFYEMFFDDAETVSNLLGLTLTGRECGGGNRAPMCGIPYHSANTYIARLTRLNYKVAICEQIGEVTGNGPMERKVVRIITPGTIMDEGGLDQSKNNYIAAISASRDTCVGVAWLDLSTGAFFAEQFLGDSAYAKASDHLASLKPSEIISDDLSYNKSNYLACVRMGIVPNFYQHTESSFEYDKARKLLLEQLKKKSLADIDCEDYPQCVCSAGGLLHYLSITQMRTLEHINKFTIVKNNIFMELDINTRLNLEICETMYDRKKRGSLLWVIDKTQTTMGARKLRNWLEKPLQNINEINARLDAVEELTNKMVLRAELRELLRSFQDIERISSKASYGNLNPKNCQALGYSLEKLPQIQKAITSFTSKKLKESANKIICIDGLAKKLISAFVEDVPTTIKEGGFIRPGFDKALDDCVAYKENGRDWVLALEAKEREKTGNMKLKIQYNRVAGYFFEVAKNMSHLLPERFVKIQAMATTDRYMTEDLQSIADSIANADVRRVEIELAIFDKLRREIMDNIPAIQQTAEQIATVDCLLSLAEVAIQNDYTRPDFSCENNGYEIIESRHPVIEKLIQEERFVPNDVLFNADQRTIIITGPNMAGKSTYMRQIALVVLLAHVGSFVPAKSAKLSLTDRIFTRIGASDNLGMGQSTFMVEMSEVANIIKNATKNSLLILDEIGRGTSTQDGMSIAWAVLEYIASSISARTLFSTHYHKLTELQGKLPGVINMFVTVSEFDNKMTFLRKVEYGSTSQSYGIEVARFAGIPDPIINRAKDIMNSQESEHAPKITKAMENYTTKDLRIETKFQIIKEMLDKTDINNLTPLEAFSKIAELKKQIND